MDLRLSHIILTTKCFQVHHERIVAQYNQEKDRATIEQTFESLLRLVGELSEEEQRTVMIALGGPCLRAT
jgi:hypothetical protein